MGCPKAWIFRGAILAGLAVVFGAFGAHVMNKFCVDKYGEGEPKMVAGMEFPLSYKRLEDFKTGARYQMYHALAIIMVGLLAKTSPSRTLTVAGWCFLLGIVLFSGSLYALTITGNTYLGRITPFGGLFMIAGWIAFAKAAIQKSGISGDACPANKIH
jgi:uncharacterized membrane protein YgdD (TMEM256/DUF423 family)